MVRICNIKYPEQDKSKYEEHFDLFPYELSDFQKYAIEAIVEGQHTLVTAHTGSGKTLPAEFAIQHFTQKGKKVIYTSPIKALSNQKFYDFQIKYPNISFGLFTGDIKTNPEADVLIMTTEILMNKLFKYNEDKRYENEIIDNNETISESLPQMLDFQIDIETELGCVVFDEVHYINDRDRGQNWEKTILMLPNHIQMVMLSATIDSPEKFAKWCEKDGDKQVYLCSTDHRVVPLGHYGFLTTNEGLYKGIKDDDKKQQLRKEFNKLVLLRDYKGVYNDKGYNSIKTNIELMENKRVFVKRQHVLNNLALFLRDNTMLPSIFFIFSRKHVEQCAKEITIPILEDDSKIPYIVKKECDNILRRLPNYEEYMKLEEYQTLVGLLEKGIGIHHSGMIPILREIVEMMISKKYIKILFATESFAIGLDCPIKTAVFCGLTKFDGSNMRYVLPHEYTQMAGRAGRRGLDKIGYVVHCNNLFSLPTQNEYKQIMCGKPQQLVSKYKINYGLLLNLLQSGRRNNFHEFSKNSMVYNEVQTDIVKQQQVIDELHVKKEGHKKQMDYLKTKPEDCEKYIQCKFQLPKAKNKQRKQLERQIKELEMNNRSIIKDSESVERILKMTQEIDKQENILNDMKTYIEAQSKQVLKVMELCHFVDEKENEYTMTPKGESASHIAEIHPLIICDVLEKYNYFNDFEINDIIKYMAIFCDIKVKDDIKQDYPKERGNVENIMSYTYKKYDEYKNLEFENNVYSGYQYDNVLNFDTYEYVEQWCNAENEIQCRMIIKTMNEEKDISVGDFCKGLLKINTLCKEIYNLGMNNEEYELCQKLSTVETKILKFVVTNQSLYV